MAFVEPDLATLWLEDDPSTRLCLFCQLPFTEEALIRTFKIMKREDRVFSNIDTCSKTIEVKPGHMVLFFDRHLSCLLKSAVRFAAVSHVWHREISNAQSRNFHTPQAQHLITLAIDSPIRIFHGLRDSPEMEDYECWHDYFSVPQWTPKYKEKIVLVIHELFHQAHTTVIFLDDVSPEDIQHLYHSTESQDRLLALTAVCNSRWFKRLWTAMEFVRSSNVRMMTSDYKIANTAAKDPIFWEQMHTVWNEECTNFGSVHNLETHLSLGNNLVPWSLGPLLPIHRKGRVPFALAFALLSCRGCRYEQDFLHALRGIVVGGEEIRPLATNFFDEYYRIAMESLLTGDVSPLFITPYLKPPMKYPRYTYDEIHRNGYNDVTSWGLGDEVSRSSTIITDSIKCRDRNVYIKLQRIGLVSTVRFTHQATEVDQDFRRCAMLAFQHTGPDVEGFVETLVTRLYGGDGKKTMASLREKDLIPKLQSVLNTRYNCMDSEHWPESQEENHKWLMEILEISKQQHFLSEHGSTIHGREYCHILGITCTNCHGTFLFRVAAFVPPDQLRHAMAYRILDLQYDFSHPNGMALLVQNFNVVGRMMWATPACPCNQMVNKWIRIPLLPRPVPRDQTLQNMNGAPRNT